MNAIEQGIEALKKARFLVQYSASGCTHSGEMTGPAQRTLIEVDAALSALQVREQPTGFVRYCAHCGSIGAVEAEYRDCCPDGDKAVFVPELVADQAKMGFRQMVNASIAAPVAALTVEQIATLREGLRDWEIPENRYAAQRLLDAIESRALAAAPQEQEPIMCKDMPVEKINLDGACYFLKSESLFDGDEILKAWNALVQFYVAHRAAPVAAQQQDDTTLLRTIDERDDYHDMADRLAEAIATHFGIEIGEHSSGNCPWTNALEWIESAQDKPQAGQARELPVLDNPDELEPAEFLASRLISAWCDHHGKRIPWAKAIEISAIVTKMPAEEKAALLALDDAQASPAVPDEREALRRQNEVLRLAVQEVADRAREFNLPLLQSVERALASSTSAQAAKEQK